MLRRNGLAKKYNTERYNILLQIPRIFRHISNKGSILTVQYKSKVNLLLTVYEYIIVYKYILLSNFTYIYIYIYIYKYICVYIYIYTIYVIYIL